MIGNVKNLRRQIEGVTGPDRKLDRVIAEAFDFGNDKTAMDFTESVDACLQLIRHVCPDATWHIGFGPNGVIPYAAINSANGRFEASAPTVPLALLNALVLSLKNSGD